MFNPRSCFETHAMKEIPGVFDIGVSEFVDWLMGFILVISFNI